MRKTYSPKSSAACGKLISIHNKELYYEEYGVGKPLVLLHGYGGCSQNWLPFISDLSVQHRLILVDLPGHGYSTNPQNKFTHCEAAKDVFHLLDKLGIEHFSAIGMSSVGMVLLHMATSQLKRINSMVLISATTHFPQQAREIMRRASFKSLPQPVKEMYQNCAKGGEKQIHQLLSQFNAFATNEDDMNFTTESLSKITAHTLVVHGEHDQFFPLEIAENMYHSIPNAAIWIIPQGEHVPIYDSTLPFTSRALQFIAEANTF